jgi:hypothetical protein
LKSKGAAHRARFRIGSWKGKRYRHILSGIGADAHRSHNVKDLFAQKGACLSSKLTARADCRFQFNKRSQLFIHTHNVCGGSQIVAELKEFPVRRTKTSPLPIR